MKYKAVIFDLDGVICHTDKYHYIAWKEVADKLGVYFDEISDGNNITNSKPNPEVFLKASQYLNIDAKDCLVVEDAKAGLEAAIAGNMDSAAIGDAVVCNLATYQLNTFSDLKKICI